MALADAATEQNYVLTVSVDDIPIGTFDSFTGGDLLAKSVKHRAGGMGPEISYAGLPTFSTITVSRVAEQQRDWELIRSLKDKAGRVNAQMTEQPLDADGMTWGSARVWSGHFLGIKPGKVDSNSDAVRMFELDIDPITVT